MKNKNRKLKSKIKNGILKSISVIAMGIFISSSFFLKYGIVPISCFTFSLVWLILFMIANNEFNFGGTK